MLMSKQQFNTRLSKPTHEQIAAIIEVTGESQAGLIERLVAQEWGAMKAKGEFEMETYQQYLNRFMNNNLSVPAQIFYDWRAVTGFISGIDLHDHFRELYGEPSPSGYSSISVEQAAEFFAQYADELESAEKFLADAYRYDENLDFGVESIQTEKDVLELYNQLVVLRDAAQLYTR